MMDEGLEVSGECGWMMGGRRVDDDGRMEVNDGRMEGWSADNGR